MTRPSPLTVLAATLVLAVPVILSGCCWCPTTGRIVPWSRVRSGQDGIVTSPCMGSLGGSAAAGSTASPAVAGAPPARQAAPGVDIAGQPGEAAWAAYSAAGYRTVVNFRPPSEGADREREFVVANGMQYFNLPVQGAGIEWGDADALAKILANGSSSKFLLHCSSGNRAAGVWALYQSRYHGLSKSAAIAEAERVCTLKPAMRKKLAEMLDGE